MKTIFYFIFIAIFIISGWNCTTKPVEQKPDIQKIFSHLQENIATIIKNIEPSMIYAEIGGGRTVSAMSGVILSSSGDIFLPTFLKRDAPERIQVWLNEKEYPAILVESDERLKMSIVRIQPDTPITPISFADAYTVQTGQMVIGVVNGGKANDFRLLVDVGFVRGWSDEGEFDQIQSSGITTNLGAVMMTLDGKIVALQLKSPGSSEYGRILPQGWIVSNELQRGVSKLLSKSAQKKDAPETEEEKEKGKPWLGFGWAPINEDYAELIGMPKKAILVRYVVKNSPMEQGGLKEGDLITEVDNKPLTKIGAKALESQFIKYLNPEPDREITFKVIRRDRSGAAEGEPRPHGRETATLSARGGLPKAFGTGEQEKDCFRKVKFGKKPEPKEVRAEDIGVVVQAITESDYYERNLLSREGVLVNNVLPGSPSSASTGRVSLISRNDIIVELNKTTVRDITDFINALETIRREKAGVVLVKIAKGAQTSFVALNLKTGQK
ncbi:MAG: PDZ domain-containing protein [Planctomycetota bacterium]|nr:PDZ domain-containing protein [Planctomycetota bacterium]